INPKFMNHRRNPFTSSPVLPLFSHQRICAALLGMPWLASTERPSHPPALDAPRRVLVPASTVSSCVFCEQEGWSGRSLRSPLHFHPLKFRGTPMRGWWGCPQMRASNEGLLRPRVARARRTAPPSPASPPSPHPQTLLNTSRYASSIFPKSFRNRSLSIDS